MPASCLTLILTLTGLLGPIDSPPDKAKSARKITPQLRSKLETTRSTGKAWVMLREKSGSSPEARRKAIRQFAVTCPPRTLQRRRMRRSAPGLFDERDLPVDASHVEAIARSGAEVCVVSRWLNAVSVQANKDQIETISQLPFVERIQLVGGGKRRMPMPREEGVTKLPPIRKSKPSPTIETALDYGSSYSQLSQINAIALHDLGYTGFGVVLAVLDTGFRTDHETIDPYRVIAAWDFVNDDPNVNNEPGDPSTAHDHGTKVVSIAAGNVDGRLYGPAFTANLILCKTEDVAQEQPIEEDWFVAGLEFAELNGADVVTSSLGYIDWYTQADLDGETAVTTVAVNIATANGVFCCTAAGNEGTSGLIAPADAFDVITVGAVDGSGNVAGFSSRGPTADGRVKPEVMARGVSTYGASASSATSYSYGNGTSFATPLVAGVVACLVQAHPQWSIEHMRISLTRTADYYVQYGTYDPGYARGFGIIDGLGAHMMGFVPGDHDLDFDVDDADRDHLLNCRTAPGIGPPADGCHDADLDGDFDIDQGDYGLLQRCLTGPDGDGDPDCADG